MTRDEVIQRLREGGGPLTDSIEDELLRAAIYKMIARADGGFKLTEWFSNYNWRNPRKVENC